MPDTNNHGPFDENADNRPFNLIPLDQSPGLVLRMVARFAEGLCEPMVIGANDQPVAALISIDDFIRLRDYDRHALDSEDSFYSELDHRLHHADIEQVAIDLNDFARSLGPTGEHWSDGLPHDEQD